MNLFNKLNMGGIITALFLGLTTISCSEKVTPETQNTEYTIETFRKEFSFNYMAGSLKTMVTTNAPLWVAEDNYSWITLEVIESESDGKVLLISVAENDTGDQRKGSFDIIGKDNDGKELVRISIDVTQNPKTGLVDGAIMFEDPLFENFMLEDFDLNQDKVLTEQEVEHVTTLDLENLGINSVEGIQYFKNLVELDLNMNNLKKLDVSGLSKLQYLYFNMNQISSLKCDGCTMLQSVMGRSNKLKEVNLSHLTNSLKVLDLMNNELIKLDLSGMKLLEYAAIGKNSLTSLNMTGCEKLSIFSCNDNSLSSLDLSAATELLTLDCSNNFINNLSLDKCTKLGMVNIAGNSRITAIDLSKCPIIHLIASGTSISDLQLGDCKIVETLKVSNTKIKALNLTQYTGLKKLECSDLTLGTLDLKANTLLEEIICSACGLTELNLAGKTKITKVDVSDNQISSLDLADCTAIKEVNVKGNSGITLTLAKSKENDSSLKINKNDDCTIVYR